MTVIGMIVSRKVDQIFNLVEAADGWCRLLMVNVDGTPWSGEELAILDGIVDYLDLSGLDLDIVCDQLAERGVNGLLTIADELIPFTAAIAERLGLPYHDVSTALALTHKNEQRRRLEQAGIPQPRYATFSDADGAAAAAALVGFPAVLKPVNGNGSTNVFLVGDDRELLAALRETEAGLPQGASVFTGRHGFTADPLWQVEELLTSDGHPAGDWLGDYVSVETLTLGPGDHRHIWVADRMPLYPPFRERGLGGPSLLPQAAREEVCALAAAGLDALGVRCGLSHVEIKLTPEGPRIIEINGRIGGMIHDLVQRSSGLNVLRLALESAAGKAQPVSPQTGDFSFLFTVHAPSNGREIRKLCDPDALKRVPGVWRVDVHTTPGAALDARVGVLARLQTVWLTAPDVEQLKESCLRVTDLLDTGNQFVLDTDRGGLR